MVIHFRHWTWIKCQWFSLGNNLMLHFTCLNVYVFINYDSGGTYNLLTVFPVKISLSGWMTYLYNLLQRLKLSVSGLLKTWKFLTERKKKIIIFKLHSKSLKLSTIWFLFIFSVALTLCTSYYTYIELLLVVFWTHNAPSYTSILVVY